MENMKMKTMVKRFLYLVVVIILLCGCKDKPEPETVSKSEMKTAGELVSTWKRLENNFTREPELWKDVQIVLKKHNINHLTASKKDALQELYFHLKDPTSKGSSAKDALDIFVKLGATEVVRETLLNPRRDVPGWDLVVRAADEIKNTKDVKALPHLIRVLGQNNYSQEGSEQASIHTIMKRKLIETIQQITGLDLKAEEIDVDNKNEIEDVLSLAREWAKKEKIQLFKE